MRIKTFFSLITIILLTTAFALAQDTDSKSWTMQDTVIAKRLLQEGRKLLVDKKFKELDSKLDSAAAIYEVTVGEESLEYADVLSNKSRSFYEQNELDKTIEYAEKVLKIRLTILGATHSLVAESYNNLGIAYSSKRAYNKAIEYYEKALYVRLKISDGVNQEVAILYFNLGLIFYNKGEYNQAILNYEKALQIRLKVFEENNPTVAQTYNNLGNVYRRKGEYDRAVEYYERSLQVRLKIFGENHERVGDSYYNLGITYRSKGEYDRSIQYLEKALQIEIKTNGETNRSVANAYSGLGNTYVQKGEYDQAIQYLEKALQINLEISGELHSTVATSYLNLGVVYDSKGEYNRAIKYYEKALQISLKLADSPDVLATYYNNLGVVYGSKGDYDRAIQYHEKALQIRLKVLGEINSLTATSYFNLAGNYTDKKEYNRAIIYQEKTLQINLKTLGETHPEVASVYNSLGTIYQNKQEYKNAIEYVEKALKIRIKTLGEIHPDVAASYNNLGVIYQSLSDYDSSVLYLNKALQVRLKIYGEIHPRVAGTYINLGSTYGFKGEYGNSISNYKKALLANGFKSQIEEGVLDISRLVSTFSGIGLAYLHQHETQNDIQSLTDSKASYLQAFKAIDFQQNSFTGFSSKELLAQNTQHLYENVILINRLLYQNANDISLLQESFTFSERSKAFLLYGALQESNALQFSGLPADLLQQEYDLRVDITYNEKRRQDLISKGASETDTTVLAISGKLFDLKQGYETLKKRFETEYPEYYRLKYDLSTISAEDVQRDLLQPNQALLEYFVGDSSIFVFVIRPDTLVVQEVKKDFPLEDWVKSLRENIYQNRTTGAVAYAEAAYNLYQKLIAPVKSLLPEQLIIIPDGILGYVPFEALLTAKPERAIRFNTHPYLLKEHQISYCYSATLLREMQQKKSVKEPTGALLAVAPFYDGDTTLLAGLFAYDETTRKDLAPLQHSGEEVYRISKLWKGNVLTGGDATEEKFTSQASNYKILHLATHGRADERVGDYSFLAFSEIKDSMENELLYVRDLYNLQLNADLVVLSACETGLGKLSRGEGIISLARAFAYAGAKSIVTTLWSVDDAKTKDVMVEFYRKLKKGMTKDEALRQAKLDYLKSHASPADAHPFYWAGFASIGDMRALR